MNMNGVLDAGVLGVGKKRQFAIHYSITLNPSAHSVHADFDELKKRSAAPLLAVALAGACWFAGRPVVVQVVSARKYESHLETQSYTGPHPRRARKILDRTAGCWLKMSALQPSLYLDDLRRQSTPFTVRHAQARPAKTAHAAQEKKLGGR